MSSRHDLSITTPQLDPCVSLYPISRDQRDRIRMILRDYHLPLTYSTDWLEMPGVVYGLSWEDYIAFLDALGDYNLRHTFSGGTLEIMWPRLLKHERVKGLLRFFVGQISLECDVRIRTIGSTTLTCDRVERGLQPDEAFYVCNERAQRNREREFAPPPDFIIEVETSRNVVPRLPVFAGLGVREVWRSLGEAVCFHVLNDVGEYEEVERSLAFPFIRAADLPPFVDRIDKEDDITLVKSFVKLAKARRVEERARRE